MGTYEKYLKRFKSFDEISQERKNMLDKISEIRDRDVLVIASDLSNNRAPITIEYSDLLPIQDQLENLVGNAIDVILETPVVWER